MVIVTNDRNTGPAPDATRGRRALSAVLAINELILKRAQLTGMERARSPCGPANFANIAARASA